MIDLKNNIPDYMKLNYELLKIKTRNHLRQYQRGQEFINELEAKYPGIGGKKV